MYGMHFSVRIGVNCLQAVMSMKPLKFTVLYKATLKGGKRLLRESVSKSFTTLGCLSIPQ